MIEGIFHLLFSIEFLAFALAEKHMKITAGLFKSSQTGSQINTAQHHSSRTEIYSFQQRLKV